MNHLVIMLFFSRNGEKPAVLYKSRDPLLGGQDHIPVPAYLVFEGVMAGLLFGETSTIGIEDPKFIKFLDGTTENDQVDARVQAAFRHNGYFRCPGPFINPFTLVEIIRADDTHPGFQSGFKGIPHQGRRHQVYGHIHVILEDFQNRPFQRCVHIDKGNFVHVQAGFQLLG